MEVTKKIISRLRAVAYEELRKNYTKDEWDLIFAGGITVAYLVQMRDHRKKVYRILQYTTQMNTATMEACGINANGKIDILGIINRQTKTLTPVESWEEKL